MRGRRVPEVIRGVHHSARRHSAHAPPSQVCLLYIENVDEIPIVGDATILHSIRPANELRRDAELLTILADAALQKMLS